ncbi:hypothetical protein CR62_18800 [Serratia grimesii]|uniref:Uncharacterized protein n=1 Tax=Serratia grimesii TaxID=82995 RepID=A0ABR4UCU1_9GAMM|nr:hypothetical protein CR62_18800 [Serratia grimesii]
MVFKARMETASRQELGALLSNNFELVKDILGYPPYVGKCCGPVWLANQNAIRQTTRELPVKDILATLNEMGKGHAARAFWCLHEADIQRQLAPKLDHSLLKNIFSGLRYGELVEFLRGFKPVEIPSLVALLPKALKSLMKEFNGNLGRLADYLKTEGLTDKIAPAIAAETILRSSITWGIILNALPVVCVIIL